MAAIHNSILDTIGNTPIVRINNIGPKNVNLYAKVESFNPMGSIKDRMALAVIEEAEALGLLKPGQTIVEAASGNTGIALAMVCAQKGYPLVITMEENFSVERRKLIRFLGAKVVLTPASEKGSGMVRKAQELADLHGWWQPRQFENPVNAAIHACTTAQEILDDFAEQHLDYWVSGFGTGGTFSGVSSVLREHSPHTRIILCEPDNAQLIGSGIPQVSRTDVPSGDTSHPGFRPHLMQGWSPDFIPALMESVVSAKGYDSTVAVDGNIALRCARDLASKEGILTGISAGATVAGALCVAESAPAGSNILCMLPDTGERYLSTVLFDEVQEEMTEEELEISMSTSGLRFDGSAPAVQIPDLALPDADAVVTLNDLIEAPTQPITLFGLEWCEFCWSVKSALKTIGVPCQIINLDASKLQSNDMGSKMRLALRHRTGSNTFPQIFIGGEFIGGCTDLFDAIKDRSFYSRLEQSGIIHDASVQIDPYSLLPGWLHPRS